MWLGPFFHHVLDPPPSTKLVKCPLPIYEHLNNIEFRVKTSIELKMEIETV